MVWLIVFGAATGLALLALSVISAVLYGICVVLGLTIGQLVVGVVVAGLVANDFRRSHVNELLTVSRTVTALIVVGASYIVAPGLLTAAIVASAINWYFMRESDKVLFGGDSPGAG